MGGRLCFRKVCQYMVLSWCRVVPSVLTSKLQMLLIVILKATVLQ
jgi:hypothetical protein